MSKSVFFIVLQKRALRLTYFSQAREHVIPFFLKWKLLSLEFLYLEKIANLMYVVNMNFALIKKIGFVLQRSVV